MIDAIVCETKPEPDTKVCHKCGDDFKPGTKWQQICYQCHKGLSRGEWRYEE